MSGAPAPAPPVPVLLRSLASAVLLDGRGDVALPRETRGAEIDWGGVYGQLVRLTGPWSVTVRSSAGLLALAGSVRSSELAGERWTARHAGADLEVTQEVVPLGALAGAIRSLRIRSPTAQTIAVTSVFSPYLLPVMVEGIRPAMFRAETPADRVRIRQREFALDLRWSVAPARLSIDGAPWIGGRRIGPIQHFGSEHDLPVGPGQDAEVRWVLTGGLAREVERNAGESGEPLPDVGGVAAEIDRVEGRWAAQTPTLRFPDAPGLERGYALARAALRRLYTAPGDDLVGLVAGYPWYASIWCRDLAEMLPAVLWLGDGDWARRSIASVLRFQARDGLDIVGSEAGELPMQIAPGPIFLYGTSDTSLYYPELVYRYVRHTGDLGFAAETAPALGRVLEWGLDRTDPASGLVRNGGEAEEISRATAGLSTVRYGIDAPDTTIWDSADRRDHAIDVQVLWWKALRAMAALGKPGSNGVAVVEAYAERLAAALRARYDWPEEGYLYDSIRRDGQPVRQLRPNALRAVAAGLLPAPRGARVVARALRDDLATPWGLRTLSSLDPGYRPQAYHAGEVWPIATAWAAEAAFAVGDAERAGALLLGLAGRLEQEGGYANECYRGDRPEPFNSCFLLGFSVGPFLSLLFERLWGLEVDGRVPRVTVRPRFPAGWRRASIDQLRVGPGSLYLKVDGARLTAVWSGPNAIEVATDRESRRVAPGAPVTLALGAPPGEPS